MNEDTRAAGTAPVWKPEDDRLLTQFVWDGTDARHIAYRMRRPVDQVKDRISVLKIRPR